jgi:hypothetical protein
MLVMKRIKEACESWIRRIDELEDSLPEFDDWCEFGEPSDLAAQLWDLRGQYVNLRRKSESEIDLPGLLEKLQDQSLQLEVMARSMEGTGIARELRNLSMDLLCATPSVMMSQVDRMLPSGLCLCCRNA